MHALMHGVKDEGSRPSASAHTLPPSSSSSERSLGAAHAACMRTEGDRGELGTHLTSQLLMPPSAALSTTFAGVSTEMAPKIELILRCGAGWVM